MINWNATWPESQKRTMANARSQWLQQNGHRVWPLDAIAVRTAAGDLDWTWLPNWSKLDFEQFQGPLAEGYKVALNHWMVVNISIWF